MHVVPHPIQYQGSKRLLAPAILKYIPSDTACLIEPFAGSAAISIASAARGLAKRYHLNDLNKPLIGLIESMIEQPAETADHYRGTWCEFHDKALAHYYKVREEFNERQDPKLFLYLLTRCVKGSVRYNAAGHFNQSPDKRRLGTHPLKMSSNITAVSQLLKGRTSYSSKDYKDVLSTANPNDVIYMDPPYQGVCTDRDTRYFSGIKHEEFVEQLSRLNEAGQSYIVSYDGRTGDKVFGEPMPDCLNLTQIDLVAGRSSQSTLLGREEVTVEALYLSPVLLSRLSVSPPCQEFTQPSLLEF